MCGNPFSSPNPPKPAPPPPPPTIDQEEVRESERDFRRRQRQRRGRAATVLTSRGSQGLNGGLGSGLPASNVVRASLRPAAQLLGGGV